MNRLSRLRNCVVVLVFCIARGTNLYPQVEAKAKHHRYELIDLGTAGGPNSGMSTQAVSINRHGRAVGAADLAIHDPYDPNCFNSDCFVSHAYAWKNDTATDLGALAPGVSSFAIAVNDFGLIGGVSENGMIDPLTGFPEVIAVAWKDGNIISLGTFGGNQSATGGRVGDRGEIVGGALNDILDPFANDFSLTFLLVPGATQCHAFLWRNGKIQDLGTLGGPDSVGAQVNDRGQVIGNSYTNATVNPVTQLPTLDPFFWEDGHMIDLGSLGGNSGVADWMNNRGQVVGGSNLEGDSMIHPYFWERGKAIKDLGTLGGDNGEAFAINDDGFVVGRADIAGNSAHHAFLWKQGSRMKDLGTPKGDTCTTALSINASNQVVGDSGICGVGGHGFMWENGGPIVNLQDLVIPGSDLLVTGANYINDRGEIACLGTVPDGSTHACLLIPTDQVEELDLSPTPKPLDAAVRPQDQTAHTTSPLARRSARRN
jgi:probable HAF family extracellular repeat protein